GDAPTMTNPVIHPRGTFTVDPSASTGKFAGASGGGSLAVDGEAGGGGAAGVGGPNVPRDGAQRGGGGGGGAPPGRARRRRRDVPGLPGRDPSREEERAERAQCEHRER